MLKMILADTMSENRETVEDVIEDLNRTCKSSGKRKSEIDAAALIAIQKHSADPPSTYVTRGRARPEDTRSAISMSTRLTMIERGMIIFMPANASKTVDSGAVMLELY